jgi:hypothetical protein
VENFAYNSSGAEDKLVTLAVDLSTATSGLLSFDLSYAVYGVGYDDRLRIDVSTDCGLTWQPTGYDKTGSVLATAPNNTGSFAPTAAGEWRNESINLTPWLGQTVKFAFVNVNDFGNNLYIDNVNISAVVGINRGLQGAWRIYPNPNNGQFTLEVDALGSEAALVQVHDLAGRMLYSRTLQGNGSRLSSSVILPDAPAGVYTLSLTRQGVREVRKLMVH